MLGSSDGRGLTLGLSSGLRATGLGGDRLADLSSGLRAGLGGDRLADLTEVRLELHGLGLGEPSGVKPSERSDGVLSSSSLD